MKISAVLLSLIFVFTTLSYSFSQETKTKDKQYFSLSTNYSHGNILPTTDFVKGNNLSGKPMEKYEAYSLKALWQNPGNTDWQKVYRGPYYGFGFSLNNFFNTDEVGLPVSFYGVLGIPIFRLKKFELYSEFQYGMAVGWKHYDSISNPLNFVNGGGFTVHLNIGLSAFYPITKKLDIGAAMGFVHFSNGAMERPNRGFNIYSPSVELKYHFSEKADTRNIKSAGKLPRTQDLLIMFGYGNHQLGNHEFDSNYFAVGGISAIYFNQFSNALRIGGGIDLNYWWGLNALPDGTIGARTFENFTVGLIIQPEVIVGNLTLVGGLGIYAHHLHFGSFNQTYQRLGANYTIYKNYFIGANIRALQFYRAEFFEFNFGYRFKWKK